MKTNRLELVDFKNIEATAEHEIKQANVMLNINEHMLSWAKKQIHQLGGKTSEEEEEEDKKIAENTKENTIAG